MLNMDMVGRVRDNKIDVLGGESAAEWTGLVEPVCDAERIRCGLRGDGYGPSDHMPFYAAGIPVLHFFSGAHSDYHRPTDDVDLLNAAGTAQVARVVAGVALAAGGHAKKLTYKRVAAPEPPGDLRLAGASLGTVPDYAGPPGGAPGVLLAGVRPAGAAEKAGLMRGDVIISIDGHAVTNIEDLMFVLHAAPGQEGGVFHARRPKQEAEATFGQPTRRDGIWTDRVSAIAGDRPLHAGVTTSFPTAEAAGRPRLLLAGDRGPHVPIHSSPTKDHPHLTRSA